MKHSVVEAAGVAAGPQKRSVGRRLADLFHGRPRLQLGSLLAGPIGWLVIGYIGSLFVMLVAAFWQVDALSGEVSRTFTYRQLQGDRRDSPCTGRDRPHGRDSGRGDRDRRPARLPDRLLHGEGREPADEGGAGGRDPDASVVVLPRQGVRVADDAVGGRDHQLGAGADRPQRPRIRHDRGVAGGELLMASLHDPPDLRGARANPELPAERVGGPRRRVQATRSGA